MDQFPMRYRHQLPGNAVKIVIFPPTGIASSQLLELAAEVDLWRPFTTSVSYTKFRMRR